MKSGKVLVLDGDQRSALAVVRSLGRAGLHVIVGESNTRPLAGASKHCAAVVTYPSPQREPQAFVAAVAQHAERLGVDVVLPMTDVSTGLIAAAGASFPRTRLPLPDSATFRRLSNKQELASFATELGVPVPKTVAVNGIGDLDAAVTQLRAPFVVKPVQSKIWFEGQWIATAVRYADSAAQLREIVHGIPWLGHVTLLVQECIRGEGQGVFALYDRGRPVAWFAHRRIREKPPTGGISVVCESVPLDAHMHAHAERLLTAAGWHGVAMVEFKVAADGSPFVIEVNGRFWGSLQLAIDCGVDFPLMLYRLAMGETVTAANGFATGRRSRWLLGDFDHLYLVLKGKGAERGLGAKLRAVGRFLNFFAPRTQFEINRLGDFRPFLRELSNYFAR
jgi:predicted ATP-grasp superfamily ATP-dependent carboligase